MAPPTRSEFLRSRFFRSALTFNKRNEKRLEHLRELLEKRDQKTKTTQQRSGAKKRYVSTWKIPECDNTKGRTSGEELAIQSASNDESHWVHDEAKEEYILTLGGVTVMSVPDDMFERLKPYQRDAVKWCAGVGHIGGILADDMGMGKTFMSIASLGAKMRVGRVRMALVVAPVSVMSGWAKEGKQFLSKFAKGVRIVKVYGGNQKARAKTVRNAWKNSSPDSPHVIISSWGLVASPRTIAAFLPPSGHHYDQVILDEAHVIKNHTTNRNKCIRRICHKRGTNRLLLTGTPFQNDTNELWSIVHMATNGQVIGKLKDFNKEYGKPIRDARNKSASSYTLKQGAKANEQLQETLKPYLLRRDKLDFLADELGPKLEICVWVKPSNQQKKMYEQKIKENGYLAKKMLSSDTTLAQHARCCAFKVLGQLRNVCGHPLRLLKGGDDGDIQSALNQMDIKTVLNGSKKLELAIHMINGFKAEDHKTLLFSQSTESLDIIQHVLLKQGKLTLGRLVGSVSEAKREDTIDCFQKGLLDVLLLSTGAGGVGITLTRATRVIVYDPSWNPFADAQAVDRAHRLGQHKEVRVYRLFVAGSIEEKMYEKQVHKVGLEKTIFTEGSKWEERLFDQHELCKVFQQIPDGNCKLLKKFEEEGVAQVVEAHRHDLVRAHPSVVGISNHSNIYCQKRKGAFADVSRADAKRCRLNPSDSLQEPSAQEA